MLQAEAGDYRSAADRLARLLSALQEAERQIIDAQFDDKVMELERVQKKLNKPEP